MTSSRHVPPLRTRAGIHYDQPLFLPVYQPRERVFQLAAWEGEPRIEGIIVNAYFLYKVRELRTRLAADSSLKDFVGFPGLVTTDSGAPFPNKIVNFDVIRSDGLLSAGPNFEATTQMLQVRTDDTGRAWAFWRMGTDAGCGNNRVAVTSQDVAGSVFFCASADPRLARQILP